MTTFSVEAWKQALLNSSKRKALPILTHPGVEDTGRTVLEAVTDGRIHFEAVRAVAERYPESAAATTIMDLTVEAEAFGAGLTFHEDDVPSVVRPVVRDAASIEALQVPGLDAGRIQQYLLASRLAAENIDKPVFAGCIGPFSLAGRLYDMTEIMTSCYLDPDAVHALLRKCTDFLLKYVAAQKAAGTAGIVMAEPAAGLLDADFCAEFSSKYVREIVEAVQDDRFMLILHNCGNSGQCTDAMVQTGAAALHFGNAIDMQTALNQCPADVLAMGNLDPVQVFKLATPEELYNTTLNLLEKTAAHPNFILSSGCDTPPGTPHTNIEAFYRALDDFNQSRR